MNKWRQFRIDEDLFIVKFHHSPEDKSKPILTCWLSDFTTLWTEAIDTEENLMKRFSEQNQMIVVDNIATQIVRPMNLFSAENVKITRNDVGNSTIDFNLKYYIESIPLLFPWKLQKCGGQVFFEMITKSLLHQIFELQENEKNLIEVIDAKTIRNTAI